MDLGYRTPIPKEEQLELDLNAKTPAQGSAVVAEPTPFGELDLSGNTNYTDKIVSPVDRDILASTRAAVLGNPVLNVLRGVNRGRVTKDMVNTLQGLDPTVLPQAYEVLMDLKRKVVTATDLTPATNSAVSSQIENLFSNLAKAQNRVLFGHLDDAPIIAASDNTLGAPTGEAAPEVQAPIVPKGNVTRLPKTRVIGTEDSNAEATNLTIKADSVEDTTLSDGVSLTENKQRLSRGKKVVADIVASGKPVPPEFVKAVKAKETEVATQQVEANDTAAQLFAEAQALLEGEPDAAHPTSEEANISDADAILRARLAIPGLDKAPVIRDKPVKQSRLTSNESGDFRMVSEAEPFASWVDGGHLVGDLAGDGGFSSKPQSGVPLWTGDFGGSGMSYGESVQARNLAEVAARWPFIEAPADSDTVASRIPFPFMGKGERGKLTIPVVTDSEGNPLRAIFTNNPREAAAAIDLGHPLYIPKEVIEGGTVNPSISYDQSGRVTKVVMFPGDPGVMRKGDLSASRNAYAPPSTDKYSELSSLLRSPTPAEMLGAGKTAKGLKGLEGVALPFTTYIDDVYSLMTQDGSKMVQLKKSLMPDVAEGLVNNALTRYATGLQEFGLANRIRSRVENEDSAGNKVSLTDNQALADLVNERPYSEGGNNNPKDAAEIISKVYPEHKGASDLETLGNYARSLYEARTEGVLQNGPKQFTVEPADRTKKGPTGLLDDGFRNAKKASDKRKNEQGIQNGTYSLDEHINTSPDEELNNLDSHFSSVIHELASEDSMISGETIHLDSREALDQLHQTLEADPRAESLLRGLVNRSLDSPLPEKTAITDIVDQAQRILNSSSAEVQRSFSDVLKTSDAGLALSGRLIDAGWAFNPESNRAVTPRETEAVRGQIRNLDPNGINPVANAFDGVSVTPRERTPEENRQLRIDTKAYVAENFPAIGTDELTVAAARKANTEDSARLNLRSGDSTSVVEALTRIQDTGTPMQQRVAGLLLEFKNIINNTHFVVGDTGEGRFAGAYMPDSNMVVLNLSGFNGRGLTDVILHEYIHAISHQIMSEPKTEAQAAALTRIGDLRRMVSDSIERRGVNSDAFKEALSNDMEFLSYGLTDPRLQAEIAASTPTAQRSLFTRFVDTILSALGVKGAKMETHDAVRDLLDFTRMAGNDNTFNIKSDRQLELHKDGVTEGIDRLREMGVARQKREDWLAGDRSTTPVTGAPLRAESIVDQVAKATPRGFTNEVNPDLKGVMAINRFKPGVIEFHPELLKSVVEGLSPTNAKAMVQTLVNHELSHAAADATYTIKDYTQLADMMGPEMRDLIADKYYSVVEPDYTARQEMIRADRESGQLPDWKIAGEFVRMEIEKAAYGRTSEDRIKFLQSDPTIFAKFVEGANAFITRLRLSLTDSPTFGTAASVSRMARTLRAMENGSLLPPMPKVDPNFAHSDEFFDALQNGSDQSLFALPIGDAAKNGSQAKSFSDRLKEFAYNLPPEFRALFNAHKAENATRQRDVDRFQNQYQSEINKALASGVLLEDVRSALGSTEAAMDALALKRVQYGVDNFVKSLPKDMAMGAADKAITDKKNELYTQEKRTQDNAFLTEQANALSRIREAGFNQLADNLTDFRSEMNTYNVQLGFADSAGIYLTRVYKLFNTEGWAAAAKRGGTWMVEGKEVDFNALRETAAKAFERDVVARAAADGVVLSPEEIRNQTHAKLDDLLEYLTDNSSSSAKDTASSIRRDMDRYLPKRDGDAGIRALMGEVTDPMENAIRTMFNVSRLATNERLMNGLRDQLINSEIGSMTPKEGYVQPFGAAGNEAMGALAGIYLPPDLAKSLKAAMGTNGRVLQTATDESVGKVMQAMSRLSGFTIGMKALISVGHYPRNLAGMQAILAAQGISPINKFTKLSFRLSALSNFAGVVGTAEELALVRKYSNLRVLNDGPQQRIFQDMIAQFNTGNDMRTAEQVGSLLNNPKTGSMEAIVKALTGLDGPGSAKAISEFISGKTEIKGMKFTDVVGGLHGYIEGAAKLQYCLHHEELLERAYGDKMTPEQREVAAADSAKRVIPTYSEMFDGVKSLTRSPLTLVVLPFARWKSEIFRTMVNTVTEGINEIKSDNDVMRMRGFQRLGCFGTMLTFGSTVAGMAFTAAFGALSGKDDKKNRELTDDEAYAIKEGYPGWQKSHTVYSHLNGDSLSVVDMASALPYSQFTDITGIISGGLKRGEGLNLKDLAGYVSTQLIGTNIAANTVTELATNSDTFKRKIYNDGDDAHTALFKMMAYGYKGLLEPAVLAKAQRIIRPGEKDSASMLFGEASGTRPTNFKLEDIAYSGMRNIAGAFKEATDARARLSSSKLLTESDVNTIVPYAQSLQDNARHRLYGFTKALDSMQLSPAAQSQMAKDAGISPTEFGQAKSGISVRWNLNQASANHMVENVRRGGEEPPANRVHLVVNALKNVPTHTDITSPKVSW